MQFVQFDYVGPTRNCAQQEQKFVAYSSPFSQSTQVGGGMGSLATCGDGRQPESWQFVVTATDMANQTTTAAVPFALAVSNK
jgi:hypothetical protein